MSARWLFAIVGVTAMLAGAGLWLANRPQPPTGPPSVTPEALFAATFHDAAGEPQSLARFRGIACGAVLAISDELHGDVWEIGRAHV